MSRRAWKATRQNALGQWKSSLFQMVWSYLLFPSPNCLLWSKTKTQSLTFSQYLSNFKGYWKDAVISLYACWSQEHEKMPKCQIVLRSSWAKIEPLTRKYFVAFSFRKRSFVFWRTVLQQFLSQLKYFAAAEILVGYLITSVLKVHELNAVSIHGAWNSPGTDAFCNSPFPDAAFSSWHLHWPVLNLSSFLCPGTSYSQANE